MLWAPTHVLATQIGKCLEISSVLVSFLLGFGFKAFVVCGWVDAPTSKMDRSKELCKLFHISKCVWAFIMRWGGLGRDVLSRRGVAIIAALGRDVFPRCRPPV